MDERESEGEEMNTTLKSSWTSCREFEEECMRDTMIPFIKWWSGGDNIVRTDSGRLSLDFQKKYGDAIVSMQDGDMMAVECKSEEKWTGNFFFEMWSNRSRFTLGWMYTLDCDILMYYFKSVGLLFVLDWKRFRQWAFGSGFQPGKIYDEKWPEKRHGKRAQLNDSWGRCVDVPVALLNSAGHAYDVTGTTPVEVAIEDLPPPPKEDE